MKTPHANRPEPAGGWAARFAAWGLACVLVFGASRGRAEDWPHPGADPQRTRATAETLPGSPVLERRDPLSTAPIRTGPAVGDGRVVVAGDDGKVRALSETTGALLWERDLGSAVRSSPALHLGRVRVSTYGGQVAALDAVTGAVLWTGQTGATELSSPLAAGGSDYQGSGFPNPELVARNAADGSIQFRAPLGQHSYSSPAKDGATLFVGANDGELYAIDSAGGARLWSFLTGGTFHQSSPVAAGGFVYCLPGGKEATLYRIAIDPARWALDNWALPMADPAPPGGAVSGVKYAVSSPALSGGKIGALIRFDHYLDNDGNWYPDEFVLHEYAVQVDAATGSLDWMVPNGSLTVYASTDVPTQGVVPAPAADAAGGSWVFGSSLDPDLRVLAGADGSALSVLPQDAPTLAAPALANGRLYSTTEAGSLYVYRFTGNSAPNAPTGGTPTGDANVLLNDVPLAWNDAADAEDAPGTLRYRVRVDDDDEVLQDWDQEFFTTPGQTTVTAAGLTDDTPYTWIVRAVDPDNAASEWSAPQRFWVNRNQVPPAPIRNLAAAPADTQVQLTWTNSPSRDVRRNLVFFRPAGGAFGAPQDAGLNPQYTVSGLTNGVTYDFRIIAEDLDGFQSTPADIAATPKAPISIHGVGYTTLQDAVAAANPGDVIEVGYGTFPAGGTLAPREGVSIIGQNPHDTRIDATGLAEAFRFIGSLPGNSPTFTLADLAVFGAGVGVHADSASVLLRNLVFRDTGTAIRTTRGTQAQLRHLTLADNDHGLRVEGGSIVDARGLLVQDNRQIGIDVTNEANTVVLGYDDVVGNAGGDYAGIAPAATDLAIPVAFRDRANKDYRLPDGAPTVDRGDPAFDVPREPSPNGGRINIGAFGDTFYAAKTSHDLTITTAILPEAAETVGYHAFLRATGGTAPYSWSILVGGLPPGIALDAPSGMITGSPPAASAGDYAVRIEVRDAAGNTFLRAFVLRVYSAAAANKKKKRKGCFVTAAAAPPAAGFVAWALLAAAAGAAATGRRRRRRDSRA